MNKFFLLLFLNYFFTLAGYGQSNKFYLSNNLKFLNTQLDTVPAPFTGGMINPIINMMDLNNDQIKDLIVFDKTGNKVSTYLNLGISGQSQFIHAPKYEAAFPQLFNWVILIDFNCDGKEDLFTGTPLSGFSYYKNTSRANNVTFFLEQYELKDTASINLYCQPSDIPAMTDVDNDGDIDILTFGPLGGAPTYFRNFRVELGQSCDSIKIGCVDFCWGSFQESATSKEIALGLTCPGQKFYKNDSSDLPIVQNNAHGSSTLLLFDNDGDGDQDLLLGDQGYSGPNFIKNGKTEFNYPYDTAIAYDTIFPLNTEFINLPSFPAMFYHDVNNDNKNDLLVSPFDPNQGQTINQIWMYPNAGLTNNPNFQSPQKGFLSDMSLDFGSRSVPYFFDSDGDGDLDLILSARGENLSFQNSKDRLILFENRPSNNTPIYHLTDTNWLNFMSQEIKDLSPVFVDLTNDGLMDLLIGERSGKIRYYKNTGNLNSPIFNLEDSEAWGIDVGNSATPSVLDFNKDGLIDLLIGAENGSLKYYQNMGNSNNPQFSNIPSKNNFGEINVCAFNWGNYDFDPITGEPIDSSKLFELTGHSAPFIYDLNENDTIDLIVGSKSGQIFIFYDISNYDDSLISADTIFYDELGQKGFNYNLGGNCYPYVGKIRNDSIISLLSGSIRGGLLYFESVQPETSNSGSLANNKGKKKSLFKVYPNPASSEIFLERDLSLSNEIIRYEIYNSLGQKVGAGFIPQGEKKTSHNMNLFINGIYFIQFYSSKNYIEINKISVIK